MEKTNFIAMFGTSPHGRGGIASVSSEMLKMQGLIDSKFQIKYVVTHSEARSYLNFFRFIRSLFTALFYAFSENIRIFHLHVSVDGSFFRKFIIFLILTASKKTIVFHSHSGNAINFYEKNSGNVVGVCYRFMVRRTKVVVTTKSWKELYDRIFGIDCLIIPNPVDIPPFFVRKPVRNRIVYLGRMSFDKGVDDLLDAAAILKSRSIQFTIDLIGEGNTDFYKRKVVDLGLENHVAFKGWLVANEKFAVLSEGDLFVLPSHYEAVSLSLIECMGLGIPSIGCNVGGIPDVIVDGFNGMLVPPKSPLKLVEAIELYFSQCDKTLMSKHCMQVFRENFKKTEIEKSWISLYAGKYGFDRIGI